MSDEYEKWWEDYEKAEQIVTFMSYRRPYLRQVGRDAWEARGKQYPNYKWRDENHWYDALPYYRKDGQSEATMKAVFRMAREIK